METVISRHLIHHPGNIGYEIFHTRRILSHPKVIGKSLKLKLRCVHCQYFHGNKIILITMTTRVTTGYQSDDEYTLKKYKQSYSREDFKEIYCINDKSVESLEKSRSTGFLFLGCLSSYQVKFIKHF